MIEIIALIVLVLGCTADAISTSQLIKRGGYEMVSAWVIGYHLSDFKIWAWVFGMPISLFLLNWYFLPEVFEKYSWMWIIVGLIRFVYAYRNNKLNR